MPYKRWGGILAFLLFLFFFFVSYFLLISDRDLRAFAQTTVPCATPGKDGPSGTLSGIINTYYPSPASVSVSAGATSIPVSSPLVTSTPAIASGDLLLVIQMQDADIDSSNTDAYGDGIGGDVPAFAPPGPPYTDPPSTAASGWKSTNAGKYEFVVANGVVSGGAISISGVGASNGLLNSYISAPASTTQGQSTYQVIRVPQFSSATLGNVIAPSWNGSTGGIVVYDVAGNLDLTGTVNVSGRGFRGGGGRQLGGGSGAYTDYRTMSTVNNNGSKAEGIAGTPRFLNITNFDTTFNPITTPSVVDNGATNEGYPNGSYGRGAPGNAGGGSTDGSPSSNSQNSGGGGGGNGGRGGRGGRAWSSQYPTGGFGGKEFSLVATNRIVLGGGGGAGTTNNGSYYISSTSSADTSSSGAYSSGAAGGGMVFIRTNTVSNTGTVLANGANAPSVTRDGGGGGGAGGSVLVTARTGSLAGLTVSVQGGKGGDANFNQAHGPGGGGGGGVIITTTPGITVAASGLAGGAAGVTVSNSLGANFTSEAGTGLVGTIAATTVPGVKSGAECSAQLTVNKTTSTPNISNQPTGTTATYAIAVSNAASVATATTVNISDALPSGFTYASTSSITLTGGATQPTTSIPTIGSNNPTWGQFSIPGAGKVQITFVVNVPNTVATGTYQNPATATYLDPKRTTTTGTTTASYDPASSTGEDVTISVASPPKLLLVKRVTRINKQDLTNIVDGRSDVPVTAANYVAAPRDTDDNDPKWPTNYLRGLINAGAVQPGDDLEYTIYFLSNGASNANNVRFCDLVPNNATFLPTAFNGLTPNDGGLTGADQGITMAVGSASPTVYFSNVADSDRGFFYNPNDSNTPSSCGTNINGAVMVNITRSPDLPNLPAATGSGTPSNSYGFVRFRAKVK